MQDLLKQLQELMPLAANATAGPWDCCPADYEGWSLIREADAQRHHEGQPEDFASLSRNADAVFLTAARNLLTPENLTLLVAALAPQWVSVAERLPKETGIYLVFGNCTGEYNAEPVEDMAVFYPEAAIFSKYRQPSHWMPLPAAPATTEGSQPNA